MIENINELNNEFHYLCLYVYNYENSIQFNYINALCFRRTDIISIAVNEKEIYKAFKP